MGTTLQNGVYLPNEGERNCYAGLKTNWEILDQKVADVTALQQAVAGALHREIVESLPTTDIDPNTIYMILSGTSATENVYNEFMYVNNAWELIGTSATDLTNYYTKGDVDGLLLLKANASDLTSHTGDTTIHVTTADKNKWNNQTYVFRYSSTALVASSTNSNALLDNTDNLKVGDKVIDSSGVLFSITAIDTANSTFTIGTSLIDLAQDSDVVHKSGEESVTGSKRFGVVQNFTGYPSIRLYGTNDDINVLPSYSDQKDIRYTDKNNNIIAYFVFQHRNDANEPFRTCWRQNRLDGTSNYYSVDFNNLGEFYPENNNAIKLGTSLKHWSEVYATNYYYGSNNVEFSTKFVTTDTAQTISESKTFANTIKSQKEIEFTGNRLAYILPQFSASYSGLSLCTYSSSGAVRIGTWKVDDNDSTKHVLDSSLGYLNISTGSANSINIVYLTPRNSTNSKLGDSTNKWNEINGLEPSSLSLPSNTGYVDISSYFTNTGDGQTNSYTASANGWIYLNVVAKSLIMQIRDSNDNVVYADMCNRSSDGTIYMTIPIGSGNKLLTQWFTSSSVTVTTARFIPCQGNV